VVKASAAEAAEPAPRKEVSADLSDHGAGLGFRRTLMGPLEASATGVVDFLEVAPENWICVGGTAGRRLRQLSERWPLYCHGLSLSLGGPAPLDETLLQRIRRFLDLHRVPVYSEHLSWCSDDGHLYDLLPIPFTEEAVAHVAGRIRQAQDLLGRRIAVENASFYTALATDLTELEFILAVLDAADCDLLLDVNNVYVNSVNHRYDPVEFLRALPGGRIRYIHVAGHYREAEDLIIDTHGADVIDPVWRLLDATYAIHGLRPTLLERDFNIPPLPTLLLEVEHIRSRQAAHATSRDDNPVQRLHG
jgi:uncharacterized protein (UPF0276 family)